MTKLVSSAVGNCKNCYLPLLVAELLVLSSFLCVSSFQPIAVGGSGGTTTIISSSSSSTTTTTTSLSSVFDHEQQQQRQRQSAYYLSSSSSLQQQQQQLERRTIFTSILGPLATVAVAVPAAYANSLLEDYGTDLLTTTEDKQPSSTTNNNNKNKKTKELARDKGKVESNMEPNLRSNYYYPTNKVRYLPRIKKCSDAIPSVAIAIGNEDWDAVRDFATVIADDTILPMKLYVSSLTGGGTNVKVGFAKDMMTAAKTFEKEQSLLVKSVDKKDASKASLALEGMAEAMLSYRTIGKLLGPDGGGDIPSVDEIRRSTKRFRGEAFEAKVKERDARIKAAAAVETGTLKE